MSACVEEGVNGGYKPLPTRPPRSSVTPLRLFLQGTRWVLQSQRMDARIGWTYFQPEQLQVLNPILILTLIPLFDHVIYPLAEKCVRMTPLRRIGIGIFLTGVAFVISGALSRCF